VARGAAAHYLARMTLPRPASPRVLWNDIVAFSRDRTRHQWTAAALALAIPLGIVTAFVFDTRTNIMPSAQVIFANSWSANRTDAEIKAQQQINLRRRRAAEEERRRQFQRVDENLNRLGI
jgi:hypothetical protein